MTRQPMRLNRFAWLLILLVCAAFALRALSLIEATGLWSDELYTVGKSFQPSVAAMLAMLR
jgi:mannosyltransferase